MSNRPQDSDRVHALFEKLGPDSVRKHLKSGRFQPQDVPHLERLLAKHDFKLALPALLKFVAGVVTVGAAVVSCWKM